MRDQLAASRGVQTAARLANKRKKRDDKSRAKSEAEVAVAAARQSVANASNAAARKQAELAQYESAPHLRATCVAVWSALAGEMYAGPVRNRCILRGFQRRQRASEGCRGVTPAEALKEMGDQIQEIATACGVPAPSASPSQPVSAEAARRFCEEVEATERRLQEELGRLKQRNRDAQAEVTQAASDVNAKLSTFSKDLQSKSDQHARVQGMPPCAPPGDSVHWRSA